MAIRNPPSGADGGGVCGPGPGAVGASSRVVVVVSPDGTSWSSVGRNRVAGGFVAVTVVVVLAGGIVVVLGGGVSVTSISAVAVARTTLVKVTGSKPHRS